MSIPACYRRVFNSATEPSRMFYTAPAAQESDGPVPWDLLRDHGKPADSGPRNAAFLEGALSSLEAAMAQGHKLLVMVPVSARALTRKEGATAVVDTARGFDPALRRRVAIELFDLPENPRLDHLEDIVIPLMPFFDRLLARPRAHEEDYTIYANINLFGVTVALDTEAPSDLTKLWANARKRRLAIFVSGVTTPGQVEDLQRYEVDGMSGPLLGGAFETLIEAGQACGTEAIAV